MQISGINNYYQPKYININKQRKTINVSQNQTTPDSFRSELSFKSRYMIKVNGFQNIHNFKNIKNPENRAFFEQLKKKFRQVPDFVHNSMWGDIDSYVIEDVYASCLDANAVVNKYAAQVLFNICHVSDKEAGVNIGENMSKLFPEWSTKTEKSKIFEEWSLDGVKTLLENAKDKNGNHNVNNLRFMMYLNKKCDIGSVPYDTARFVIACKDKNGIVTNESEERFKSVYAHNGGHSLIYSIADIKDLSSKGMKLIELIQSRISSDYHYDDDGSKALIQMCRDLLELNKGKDKEKVYDVIINNLDFIKDSAKVSCDVVSDFSFDKTPILQKALNKNKTLSAKNLEILFELKKNGEDELYKVADFLKDKNGIIRDENIKAYKKINFFIQDLEKAFYPNEQYLTYLKENIKEFTDENGVMNVEFAAKLADLCEKYEFDSHNGYVRELYNIILDFQGKNQPVDWDIVEMMCKYTRKAINNNPKIKKSSLTSYNDDIIRFVRDEKTKEILPEKVEWLKKRVDIDNPNTFKTLNQIQKDLEIESMVKDYFKNNPDYGNLYTAEDMLELLRDMSEEEILSKKGILTAPIKEGDSSILMYIADIMPTEENAKKYDKILNILRKLRNVDYNYKDEMGVSFLEKVMISENFKLLDLIKNKKIEYYPELEYVYENIQNPEFREKIKGLNIILKNTDGITANDIKSELQGIAFQNTVNGK